MAGKAMRNKTEKLKVSILVSTLLKTGFFIQATEHVNFESVLEILLLITIIIIIVITIIIITIIITIIIIIIIILPNRTFLVRFGGISGEFGRAMVRILARRSRAKIPMARPNEPGMPPKRTKKFTVPKFACR